MTSRTVAAFLICTAISTYMHYDPDATLRMKVTLVFFSGSLSAAYFAFFVGLKTLQKLGARDGQEATGGKVL